MALHRFVPTHFHNVLGTGDPVLQIADGDTVITTTLDAGGRDHANVERASRPNPMTGPFFVEGAEPDDALIVQIQRMTPTRSTGWTYSPLAPNVVDPEILPHLPKQERVDWAIDPEAGTVRLVEPPTAVADLVLPLRPMIGCFGVAPVWARLSPPRRVEGMAGTWTSGASGQALLPVFQCSSRGRCSFSEMGMHARETVRSLALALRLRSRLNSPSG
jgi:acetamidase/formamidase